MKIKACPCFTTQSLKLLWFWNHSGIQGHLSAKLTVNNSVLGSSAFVSVIFLSLLSGPLSGAQVLASQELVDDFTLWMAAPVERTPGKGRVVLQKEWSFHGASVRTCEGWSYWCLLTQSGPGNWLLPGASNYHLITYGNVKLFHLGFGVPLDGQDQ